MAKRRQKPFYFVSEEEYRLLQKLCKKSFPGEDLSLENLRNLTSQPNNEAPPTAHPGPEERVAVTDEAGPLAAASDEPLEVSDVPLPEIVGLHKDLGCLMEDAQGEYRAVPLPRPLNGQWTNARQAIWALSQGLGLTSQSVIGC